MSEQAAATGVVSSMPLVIRAVLRTDVGRVRSENQDFGAVTARENEHGHLLVVADGMGGHRGGATASRLATETVETLYLGSNSEDVATTLRDALLRANSRVFGEAQTTPDLHGMGTTTSVLAIRGNQAWFAHVGDSRIYLIRGDEISQLTDDHSLVATMVREGLLTPKEAETHPRRNVLQRSIGVLEDVEVDVRGPFEVQEYDVFVLCSDGLHGLVRPDEIKDIVLKMPIEQAADALVKRALERGGPDNITVIVARAERPEDEITVRDRGNAYDDTLRDQKSADAELGGEAAVEPLPRRSRAGAIVKWALLFVLVLGAAGVWLFMNQQRMFDSQHTSSTKR